MNQFIDPEEEGIEIGCGSGLSKLYIKSNRFKLTDVFANPWVDQRVDALSMPYSDSSLDYIVSNNMIHHLASPMAFFRECSRGYCQVDQNPVGRPPRGWGQAGSERYIFCRD